MTAVRKIETLVTYRKIGDFIVSHGKSKRQPIMERRILDFVDDELACIISYSGMTYLPTPSLG
jgi:hypothetical protein